jgi:predicted LPLAT superfamily acyltransferase
VKALSAAVATLERYVRAHWDQWFNFYDVWERVS